MKPGSAKRGQRVRREDNGCSGKGSATNVGARGWAGHERRHEGTSSWPHPPASLLLLLPLLQRRPQCAYPSALNQHLTLSTLLNPSTSLPTTAREAGDNPRRLSISRIYNRLLPPFATIPAAARHLRRTKRITKNRHQHHHHHHRKKPRPCGSTAPRPQAAKPFVPHMPHPGTPPYLCTAELERGIHVIDGQARPLPPRAEVGGVIDDVEEVVLRRGRQEGQHVVRHLTHLHVIAARKEVMSGALGTNWIQAAAVMVA